MINDILDFSKIEIGKLDLRANDFDLRAMLRELIDSFVSTAAGKGLVLSLHIDDDVPSGLYGDMPRLRQVLTNLVGNAIKFTDSGAVSVSVRCLDAQRLRIAVQDTGIGIASEDATLIFEAFAQADGSHTRRYGGTGLGLAISRQIVTLMGGEIGVDSTPHQGSTFWLVLPFQPARQALARPAEGLHGTTALRLHGHVLLVEDNLINQLVARTFLEDLALKVSVADNGRVAVERVLNEPFDLVLMDCQMPEMDGFEATAQIRARQREGLIRDPLPIIALTANAIAGDRERCLATGMDDYLSKPFTLEQLAGTLKCWLPQESERAEPTNPGASTSSEPHAGPTRPAAINLKFLDRLRELDPAGSMNLVRRILKIYLDSSGTLMAQIEQAIVAGDGEALRCAAHSLKSSTTNVGAETLSDCFKQLENLGRNGRLVKASTDFAETRREYEQAIKEIRAFLEQAG